MCLPFIMTSISKLLYSLQPPTSYLLSFSQQKTLQCMSEQTEALMGLTFTSHLTMLKPSYIFTQAFLPPSRKNKRGQLFDTNSVHFYARCNPPILSGILPFCYLQPVRLSMLSKVFYISQI